MPSDFLTPFLELDEEFCKSFRALEAPEAPPPDAPLHQTQTQRVLGFQRRHSLCPVSLPNSKFNNGVGDGSEWGLAAPSNQPWARELPRSALSHIPFRVDRSVSMIEGHGSEKPALPPPPGLCISGSSLSLAAAAAARASPPSPPSPPSPSPPHISTRYKTELCRTFEESGTCKYGAKCQFAHGLDELRGLSRHPKYKTEPCRTFHTIGFCPYGARCHFVHNADEAAAAAAGGPRPRAKAPLLRHSLSFAGFSSAQLFQSAAAEDPSSSSSSSSLLFGRASSVSPPPSSSAGSPELLSPLFPEPGALRHCPNPLFSSAAPGDDSAALRFFAVSDPVAPKCPAPGFKKPCGGGGGLHFHLPPPPPLTLSGFSGLQRCSSADSLSEEGYTSSCSLSSASSGAESPSLEGRRLPIFSRLSVSDD